MHKKNKALKIKYLTYWCSGRPVSTQLTLLPINFYNQLYCLHWTFSMPKQESWCTLHNFLIWSWFDEFSALWVFNMIHNTVFSYVWSLASLILWQFRFKATLVQRCPSFENSHLSQVSGLISWTGWT